MLSSLLISATIAATGATGTQPASQPSSRPATRPASEPAPDSDELPNGVVQLLPRGGIPAIFAPEFVSAADADIAADAWVLGVAVDGQARAYSLNLLNHHEVVNDRVGERAFAAVW